MNELEQTLQKILEKSIELAEQTGEFVIEQGTDLLQQFFMWHTMQHILGMLLGLFILFTGLMTIKLWGIKKEDDYHESKILGRWYDDEEPAFCAYTVIVCSVIASSWVLFYHTYNLIFVLVAPKLYLLEYFL